MQFASKYRYNSIPEPGGGDRLTEQAGYIEPKFQIESMIASGVRLAAMREAMYEVKPGEKVGEYDELKRQYYDTVEAHEVGKQMGIRMRERMRKKAEAARVAAEALKVQPVAEPVKEPVKAIKAAD